MNCDNTLIQDQEHGASNEVLRLSYLWLITEENFEQTKKDRGGNLFLRYSGAALSAFGNYNDFKEARSKEFELFDFKYDAQTARAYARTYLSGNALAAYVECLRTHRHGVFVWLRDVTSTNATLEIHYRAFPGDASEKVLENIEFVGVVSPPEVRSIWNVNESASYVLTRNLSSELRVAITLGGSTDSAWVPPPPQLAPVFYYGYKDLDIRGFHHSAPVAQSPRFIPPGTDARDKAAEMCKKLNHKTLVSFTTRDEGRAIHDLVCKD